jgi:hypothetical protein
VNYSGPEVRFEEVEHAHGKPEAAQNPQFYSGRKRLIPCALNPLFWMPTKSCFWAASRPKVSVRRVHLTDACAVTLKVRQRFQRASFLEILQARVNLVGLHQRQPKSTVTLEEFVRAEWKPNAALGLKKSSMRIYGYQLEKYIFPVLGSIETTLAVYTHTIPDSQKRAVGRVAGVLFSDVLNPAPDPIRADG